MWKKVQQWREANGVVLPQANPGYDLDKADQGLTVEQALPEAISR
jgi:hypothetical protein